MKFQEYLNEGLISSWLSKQKSNVIESLKKAYKGSISQLDKKINEIVHLQGFFFI